MPIQQMFLGLGGGPQTISATGGDTTFTSSGYKYHVWTTTGNGDPFNISSKTLFNILL